MMELFNCKYFWYLYIAINIATFAVYAIDKAFAVYHMRRISERTLITFTLLLGGIGALLAMVICRHKIRKVKFWISVTVSILIQVLLLLKIS